MSNAKDVFRTLAKETHPDHGGDADRFREVIKVKTDFDSLVNLANRWGIKIDDIPSGPFREALEAVVGAIVRHAFTYKKNQQELYGVIVNIRKITKGYRKGANEFKVFDLTSGQIWTLKTYEKQPFQAVVTMADVSQLNQGKEKIDRMKQYDKMKKLVKQSSADGHFDRIGLVKNQNYFNKNTHVMIEYKGGKCQWERLIRTTPKSVYVRCYGYKTMSVGFPLRL